MRPYDAGWFEIFKGLLVSSVAILSTGCWLFIGTLYFYWIHWPNALNTNEWLFIISLDQILPIKKSLTVK